MLVVLSGPVERQRSGDGRSKDLRGTRQTGDVGPWLLADAPSWVWLRLDRDTTPSEGKACGAVRAGAIHELEMKVGFAGVPGVANFPDGLTGVDGHPRVDVDGAMTQVCIRGVGAIGMLDHHMVPQDESRTSELTADRFNGKHEDDARPGGARSMISALRVDPDDSAVLHRQNARSEAGELLWPALSKSPPGLGRNFLG